MQVQKPAKVIDGIHIGGKAALDEFEYIRNNNIGLIVDCADNTGENSHVFTIVIKNFRDRENDHRAMIRTLKIGLNAAKEIDQFLLNNNKDVLVACEMGMNRSAYVIGVYLKLYRKLSVDKIYNALYLANKKRDLPVLTNESFRIIIEEI